MNTLTPDEIHKQEKRREAMRRHRAKLKALYGTTYVGQQKEAVLKYQQKVKNILKSFPAEFRRKTHIPLHQG